MSKHKKQKSVPTVGASKQTDAKKKRWMRVAAATLGSLIVLSGLEITLRLAGIGHPTSFLLRSENHGQKTFVENNTFAWRFFGKRRSRNPAPFSISRNKPAGTIRIFVFGESAALGDPQPRFGLPRMLQALLSQRHPGTRFEVINTAMTAIDSHVILPIADDCARAKGDIWVVYMGNNEVVGPFGAGTTFGAQTPPLPLIHASLALKATYIGQFMDSVIDMARASSATNSEWGGMLMFLGNQVTESDPRLEKVYANFQANLDDIIADGRRSGAGIVLSTVAANLKESAPFGSERGAGLGEKEKVEVDRLVAAGIVAETNGTPSGAARLFEAAARLDDKDAEIQFRLGRSLLASGDPAHARFALTRARDLDTLRFRCDHRLNELIRHAAAGREPDRVLLADAEKSFADASPDGLPGWDLFYEHVHLTFKGNYLLARVVAEQVEHLIPAARGSDPSHWPSMGECARYLGWTERDERTAIGDILGRLSEPPFSTQLNHGEHVRHWLQKSAGLTDTSLTNALRAAVEAVRSTPDDPDLQSHLAEIRLAAGNLPDAESAARHSLELLPSSAEDWLQLGSVYVQEKNFEPARDAFERASKLDRVNAWPLQNLALSLQKLGCNNEAKRTFRRALAISPRFGLAWLGLGQLLESEGNQREADDCFQKALQNRIHRAPELATLARFCLSRKWLEAAATNFDDALVLDPTDPALALETGRAHFLFGSQLGQASQPDRAAQEFREAARLMPDLVEPRLNLGIALYQGKHFAEARSEFEAIAAKAPTNPVAQHYLDLLRQPPPSGLPSRRELERLPALACKKERPELRLRPSDRLQFVPCYLCFAATDLPGP